jgi:hypothetical protein
MRYVSEFLGGLGLLGVIAYFAVFLAAFYGWVMNIVLLVQHIHDPISTLFVARVAGIPIAILGAVLGYIN